MTSESVAQGRPSAVPKPQLHLAGKVCLGFLGVLGVGALAGGGMLIAHPDGSSMGWTVAMLKGSPFPDFLVPGVVLAGLFGVGSFAVAAAGLERVRVAPFLAFAIGCAQMIWILVELAIIGQLSFLHPACFVIGLVIATSAVRWGWPSFRAWREHR
jgi:hypothetical protein